MRNSIRAPLAALLSLSLLSCATAPAKTTPARHYSNQNLGLELDLPDAWLLFTSGEGAPATLQPYFPPEKGPDDSPLYIGIRVGQGAFARALVEPARLTTGRYFEMLVQAVGPEVEIFSARYSAEADAVRWVYRSKVGIVDVTFHETVAVADGRAFRLGFWALTSQYPQYAGEFDELAERFRIRNGGRWEARFENLQATLPDGNLAYVEIASQSAEEQKAIECTDGRRNLLWRVENEGSVLHLFGSIHLGRKDFYPLADAVERAFESSESVVVEVDVNSTDGAEKMRDVMASAALPNGETIEDVLSPPLYTRLEDTLEELGLPIASFARLKPWLVALTLSVMKLQALGYNPQDGVEVYLLGKRGDREIVELESIDEQFAMLEALDGSLYLAYTLDNLDELDDVSESLMTAWYCGRDDELAELLLRDDEDSLEAGGVIVEKIFFERNETMAARIEELLALPGSNFVVVGAGHLVGERGIPALLRGRGFEVLRQ